MDTREVDVAIIGAGTAGMVAYQQARKVTDRVLLMESDQYGTTCARVGCMPSKLLIAAAEHAEAVRRAPTFGVQAPPPGIDGAAVMDRVRRERDRFAGGTAKTVEGFPAHHRLMGRVRFLAPGRLMVGDHTEVSAGRIVIATGSRPHVPDMLRSAGDRLVVNDDVFDWTTLPESVAVFGPGPIGLELGQALARLGVRVRLFGVGGGVGGLRSEDLRDAALARFRDEFPIDPAADVTGVQKTGEQVAVRWRDADGIEHGETFDYLLAATGRRPNVDTLDLQNSGLALDDRGAPVFNVHTLQCGDQPVFIAGDANGYRPLLHEAADEGRIAGRNAAHWPEVRAGLRRVPLSVVFTDPQIVSVGARLPELEHRDDGFAVGSVSFENQGRCRVIGRNYGGLHVYGEYGSGLFLGAEILGPEAEHLGHLLAWSVQQRMTVTEMLDMPYYHPVIEEGLRTALKQLNRALARGPEPAEGCLECGPGA